MVIIASRDFCGSGSAVSSGSAGCNFVPAFYMWVDNKILELIFRKYMRKEDLEKQIELDRAKSGMI